MSGRHIVMVDDLVQTGGTLIECHSVLAAHGAKHSKTIDDSLHDQLLAVHSKRLRNPRRLPRSLIQTIQTRKQQSILDCSRLLCDGVFVGR